MKRLIRKAFGTTVYHGTTFAALEGIVANGMLQPQEVGGGGANPDNPDGFEGFTFVTDSKLRAKSYGSIANSNNNKHNEIVVLELDIPENSLMADDNDCPECSTAEESLEKIQQAKVLGAITSDYIKQVHFYASSSGKPLLFSTNFNGCLEAFNSFCEHERDYSVEY